MYPNHYEVDSELISTIWPFLPFGIEAAYENVNDQVFFFKGKLGKNYPHLSYFEANRFLTNSSSLKNN